MKYASRFDNLNPKLPLCSLGLFFLYKLRHQKLLRQEKICSAEQTVLKTLTIMNIIDVPIGYEIEHFDTKTGKIILRPINNEKQWEGFGKLEGYYINSFSDIERCYANTANSCNKNTFPTLELAEAALALSQLLQWRDKVNNGWIPDWSDCSSDKHTIICNGNKIQGLVSNKIARSMAFPTSEIRNQFINDRKLLLEIAKPLL